MGFQELAVFVTVAREGGITAAADRMGLAKSAVSKLLKRFEERLGVRLLERSSRKIALTPEGEYLLPRVSSLLAEGERLFAEAEEKVAEPSGLVRLAMTPDFGTIMVERFFPEVLAAYPRLELKARLSFQYEDLQDPSFDLAIRFGRVNDDQLVARPLGTFRRIVVASPDYLAENPVAAPEDLAEHRCLVFSGIENRAEWRLRRVDDSADETRVNAHGPISVMSFTTLIRLARKGAGVAYVPEFMAAEGLREGWLQQCLPAWESPPTSVLLAYRFGAEKIMRIRAVRDLAIERIPAILDAYAV
ncbi:MAG: LysR family transcriptional regulator [Pseudomonadota bacterium]